MGGRLAAGVISIGVTFEIFFDVIRLMTPGVRAGVGRGVQGVQEAAGVAKGRSVGDVIDHDEGVCPSPVLGQRVRRLSRSSIQELELSKGLIHGRAVLVHQVVRRAILPDVPSGQVAHRDS